MLNDGDEEKQDTSSGHNGYTPSLCGRKRLESDIKRTKHHKTTVVIDQPLL